jgi:Peptidase family M23
MRAPVNLENSFVSQGLHAGHSIDLVTRDGLVFAPERGELVHFYQAGECGYGVQIVGHRATHVICHLVAPPFHPDGEVVESALIAIQGSSGHSTGPHVHWQINKGDWRGIWTEVGLGAYTRPAVGGTDDSWLLAMSVTLGIMGALLG